MSENRDRTALSYWFPIVEAAGLPVPKTVILDMPREAQEAIFKTFDGDVSAEGDLSSFSSAVHTAAHSFGYPVFLRTDHTSGKHYWKGNCFLSGADDIPAHLFGIAEYSEMAGLIGLPWNRWVVREMLPTMPVGICENFGDMPICREFRFFVRDGEVVCKHPYWPQNALEQGGARMDSAFDFDAFSHLSAGEDAELSRMAEIAGKALDGAWSVDLLQTERGWFLTDMAEAHKSFHWEGCPHDFKRPTTTQPQAVS